VQDCPGCSAPRCPRPRSCAQVSCGRAPRPPARAAPSPGPCRPPSCCAAQGWHSCPSAWPGSPWRRSALLRAGRRAAAAGGSMARRAHPAARQLRGTAKTTAAAARARPRARSPSHTHCRCSLARNATGPDSSLHCGVVRGRVCGMHARAGPTARPPRAAAGPLHLRHLSMRLRAHRRCARPHRPLAHLRRPRAVLGGAPLLDGRRRAHRSGSLERRDAPADAPGGVVRLARRAIFAAEMPWGEAGGGAAGRRSRRSLPIISQSGVLLPRRGERRCCECRAAGQVRRCARLLRRLHAVPAKSRFAAPRRARPRSGPRLHFE
jgi:hypothetical protein